MADSDLLAGILFQTSQTGMRESFRRLVVFDEEIIRGVAVEIAGPTT